MDSLQLRKAIPHEEFDYQTLMGLLSHFSAPRDKVTQLLRQGVIIRVKKGLYIFGEDYRKRPFSREILANLLYGPSYISLEYGLSFHGLIPEGVETVTSVALGRSRTFQTPVGVFSYRQISSYTYGAGMDIYDSGQGKTFLMAVAEKALVDKLQADRGVKITSIETASVYLSEDLRIEKTDLMQLDHRLITEFGKRYGSRKVDFLAKYIEKLTLRRNNYA